MPERVNIDGQIFAPEDARISVYDRGFLFGDSIYESFRTYGGRPFLLPDHLERLRRSAEGIGLVDLPDDAALTASILETLKATGNVESSIRVVCSRGSAQGFSLIDAQDPKPRVVIFVRPLGEPPEANRAEGVDVVIPSIRQLNPSALPGWLKSSNRVIQMNALREGREKGAFEVVLLDDAGFLAEGSSSNVFFMRGEVLCTPALSVGIFPGLTRGLVLWLAEQAGLPTKEGRFRQADLMGAEEVFLVSSYLECMPVRRVEGQPIMACPGPVTRALLDSYRLLTQRFAKGGISDEELRALLAPHLGGES